MQSLRQTLSAAGIQRQQTSSGVPNPHVPTFVVSVPASTPRSFSVGDGPPRPLRPSLARKPRTGLVGRRSGVDVTTEYLAFQDEGDEESPHWETVASKIEGKVPMLSGSRDGRKSQRRITSPSRVHREWYSEFFDDVRPDPVRQNETSGVWHFGGPVDCISSLPISATKQNAMLVHTFSELLYHFKGSFDGVPDSDNPFVSKYVPWCIQDPLLSKTSLYISARSLAERGFVDPTSAIRLKLSAIHSLNQLLRSASWITDEALAGVVQFVSIEWFFGEPKVVQAHLTGLRDMVRLRGGFTQTGVGALVTKVALVDDNVIAMSLDADPVFQQKPGLDFGYHEPAADHFRLRFNSPFLPSTGSFLSSAEALGLHPMTASILDEIRSLVNSALELSPDASFSAIEMVQAEARRIHSRISGFMPDSYDMDGSHAPKTAVEKLNPESTAKPLVFSDDASEEPPKPHSLLPKYPSSGSPSTIVSSSPISASPPTSSTADTPPSSTDSPPTRTAQELDKGESSLLLNNHPAASSKPSTPLSPLNTAILLSSLLYTQSISHRLPFTTTVSAADCLAILQSTFRIPLSQWRSVIGVLLFCLIPILPTTSASTVELGAHAGFAKSIMQIGFMQMAIEDWEACRMAMGRVARLGGWLRAGGGNGESGKL